MSQSRGPKGLYTIGGRRTDPLDTATRLLGLALIAGLIVLWSATEYTASAFGFQKALGPQMYRHVYLPWDGLVWAWRFRNVHNAHVGAVFQHQWLVLAGGAALTLAMCSFVAIRSIGRNNRRSDIHGSAHWATAAEIRKSGLQGSGGVYVGAVEEGGTTRYLRHDGPEHVLAFAPTRSGKGVGLVLPTLLSWPHSTVVHDIKGENWALTAGWRSSELGGRCLKFDPTAIDDGVARFNPLAEIRSRTEFEIQDVQSIVGMLVDPDGTGGGSEAHWIATSSVLLAGAIVHLLYAETPPSLGDVARFLSDPSFSTTEEMFQHLLNSAHDPTLQCGWRDTFGRPTATHPYVAMAARDMLNKDPKESSGVLSTATRFLALFRDPVVARNTAESDFRIADLMHDDKPVSLYLVIPPAEIDRLKPLTRLIIHQILRGLTGSMEFADGRNVAAYKHRLLLMIDELPSLGRLPILQTALAYVAGYGIKAYLIAQDLGQLTAAYGGASGRDESIVANSHVLVAFAPNKLETMELLSKLSGTTTIRTESKTFSGGRMSAIRSQVTVTEQEQARPLLTPDEARRMPPEDALIFVAGHAPIYAKKIRYYADAVFSARAKIAAPAASRSVAVAAVSSSK